MCFDTGGEVEDSLQLKPHLLYLHHTFITQTSQIHTREHTDAKMSRISPTVNAAVVHTFKTLLAAQQYTQQIEQ